MPGKSSAYDLAVIGGGPGGYVAAIKASQLGLKTALIERDKVGGACLHQGCIPTKTLLHSADFFRKVLKAREFGVNADNVGVNYPQFHRRKESVIRRLYQGVQYLLKKNGIEVFEGEGRFNSFKNITIEKNGVDVGQITSENVILATGSTPFIPSTVLHDGKYVLTSNDVLMREDIPKSIIIAGAGAVGVEFACLFNVLGTKVSLVELSSDILPAEDKEISTTLRKIFLKRGIDIFTNTSLEKTVVNNGVCVEIKKNVSPPSPSIIEGNETLKADCLLLALGRIPVLDSVGIDKLPVHFKGKYLHVSAAMETSQRGLYAIGDIAGPPLLAHKASYEGHLAVSHIAGKETTSIHYQNIPRITYCFPQIASIGLTQEEAERKGHKPRIGKYPLIANSKAIIDGEYEDGFVKIITDEKYFEILGVHAVGPNIGEFLWGMSLSANLEGTAMELTNALFPHPTLSEAFLEAARAAVDKPIHL